MLVALTANTHRATPHAASYSAHAVSAGVQHSTQGPARTNHACTVCTHDRNVCSSGARTQPSAALAAKQSPTDSGRKTPGCREIDEVFSVAAADLLARHSAPCSGARAAGRSARGAALK